MFLIFKTQLSRFRLSAFAEGLSLILLLFIAVPFKYLLDIPELSKLLGPVHGLLFILYIFQAIQTKIDKGWSIGSFVVLVLAAFIPFGTFYFVPRILKKNDG